MSVVSDASTAISFPLLDRLSRRRARTNKAPTMTAAPCSSRFLELPALGRPAAYGSLAPDGSAAYCSRPRHVGSHAEGDVLENIDGRVPRVPIS